MLSVVISVSLLLSRCLFPFPFRSCRRSRSLVLFPVTFSLGGGLGLSELPSGIDNDQHREPNSYVGCWPEIERLRPKSPVRFGGGGGRGRGRGRGLGRGGGRGRGGRGR